MSPPGLSRKTRLTLAMACMRPCPRIGLSTYMVWRAGGVEAREPHVADDHHPEGIARVPDALGQRLAARLVARVTGDARTLGGVAGHDDLQRPPAKAPVAQHQLQPLALEVDLPLQFVEPLEDAHCRTRRPLRLGPSVPGDPVLLQRGHPCGHLVDEHGDCFAAAQFVTLANRLDATARIFPARLKPIGDFRGWPWCTCQRRASHPKQRRGVARLVGFVVASAAGRELHLADDDGGMLGKFGDDHRPRLVGQPALDGKVPLGERFEEAEDLLRPFDLGRDRKLWHPATRPPGVTPAPREACPPRGPCG